MPAIAHKFGFGWRPQVTAAIAVKKLITNRGQQLELVALDAVWAARLVSAHNFDTLREGILTVKMS